MKKQVLPVLILLLSLATFIPAGAQHSAFTIHTIRIEGNRVTRPGIILRELTFGTGDTIRAEDLARQLSGSRENVFNTSLFNVVDIDTAVVPGLPGEIAVRVKVIERWYVWPMPYIEFPDRNINDWLEEPYISRLTYGINLIAYNMRGRNETLTLLVHLGFNQKYGFTYKTPYFNRKKTFGFGFGADAALNKSMAVSVEDGGNVYMTAASGLLEQQYSGFGELFYRPAWYLNHLVDLSYARYIFSDTLRSVPGFFAEDTSLRQDLLRVYYKIKFDRRDARFYPLKGYYADIELLGSLFLSQPLNIFSFKSTLKGYWEISRRWHMASGFTGRVSFPEEQPFYMQEGLGYGRDYVRGYDASIIPGQHFAILKNNLKFSVLPQRKFNLGFIDTPKFSVLPLAVYANLFADLGYVWNDDPAQTALNPLCNKFLFGYGIGLDLATYYDVVIGVNLSLNIDGVPGFFLHFIAPI